MELVNISEKWKSYTLEQKARTIEKNFDIINQLIKDNKIDINSMDYEFTNEYDWLKRHTVTVDRYFNIMLECIGTLCNSLDFRLRRLDNPNMDALNNK